MIDLATHRIARLFVLDFGLFNVGNGARIIGIQGYLLQTFQGANLLIDTGFPPDYATDPAAAAARDGLASFGSLIDFTPARTAEGQLALLGLTTADISAVILTHSHIDHVGSLPLFRCPVLITRQDRAEPRPRYFGATCPFPWPDLPYQLIDTDTRLGPDLTLIPTPGHTAGHMSAMVRLPQTGTVILAADALNRASEPAEGFQGTWSPQQAARSADRLFALQAEHDALLIFGHDPAQWPRLKKAPHSYD